MTTDTDSKKVVVEDGNNNTLSLQCPKCGGKDLHLDVYGIASMADGNCTIEEPRVDRDGCIQCQGCGYGQEEDSQIPEFLDKVTFSSGEEVLPGSFI